MQKIGNSRLKQSGSTLVAVFWLIGALGLLVMGALRFVAVDSKWIVAARSQAEARNHAESGITMGSHPAISNGDPLLEWQDESGMAGYQVEMLSEEALIPLNHALFFGRKDIVKALFVNWGLNSDQAAAVVDAMVDWTDRDDLSSLNGAEASSYTSIGRSGFPLNRPFSTLEEVEWVMGMEAVTQVKPDWKRYFTLWSSGQINLNEAEAEIIAAIVGNQPRIEQFVDARLGADGIKGTEDDRRFPTVADALGFFGTQPNPNTRLLSVQGNTRRILSTGWFHDHRLTIAETRRDSQLLWRIEY